MKDKKYIYKYNKEVKSNFNDYIYDVEKDVYIDHTFYTVLLFLQ